MHSAGMRALCRMDGEERLHFRQHPVERTGLVARGRGDGVAVHGIAGPDHDAPFPLHGADQRREMVADLVGAEAVDQRQPSGLIVGIEDVDQLQQLVRLQRGAAFQADRVLDAAEIFDMAVVELAGAVADPDHVARGRVPVAGGGIDPCEGLLVTQKQRFVAGVEIGSAQFGMAFEIEPTGAHEIQRVRDAIGQFLVPARLRGILEETEHPLMHAAEIGEAAGRKGTQQV